MLATGSVMGRSASSGCTYVRNVDGIVCMSPREGVPRTALLSQVLIACGLPPDSARMIFLTPGASRCGSPITCSASAIQPSSPPARITPWIRACSACTAASCSASRLAFCTDATRCSVASSPSKRYATGSIGDGAVSARIRSAGCSTPALAASIGFGVAPAMSATAGVGSAAAGAPDRKVVAVPAATAPSVAAAATTCTRRWPSDGARCAARSRTTTAGCARRPLGER